MDNSSCSPSNIPIPNRRILNSSRRFTNLNNSYYNSNNGFFANDSSESSFYSKKKFFQYMNLYKIFTEDWTKKIYSRSFYFLVFLFILICWYFKSSSNPELNLVTESMQQNKILIKFQSDLNELKNKFYKITDRRIEATNKDSSVDLSALKQHCSLIIEERLDVMIKNKMAPIKNEFELIKNLVNNQISDLKTTVNLFSQEQNKIRSFSQQIDKETLNNSIKLQIQNLLIDNNLDKYTKPDYASELNKAIVLDASATYAEPDAIKLFSIPIWSLSNSPSELLKRNSFLFKESAKAWKMDGEQGFIKIKLAKSIIPESFVYEHVLRNHLLDENQLTCSPKIFRVFGYTDEDESIALGEFTFEIQENTEKEFMFERLNNEISIIQFNIVRNHGNSNFTCLHRIRVF